MPSLYCATGADTVRFKAEVNFDGREVARAHVDRLNLENLLVVWGCLSSLQFSPNWHSSLPNQSPAFQSTGSTLSHQHSGCVALSTGSHFLLFDVGHIEMKAGVWFKTYYITL